MIVNPDYDEQLIDPALTNSADERRELVLVPRSYNQRLNKEALSMDDASWLHENALKLYFEFS